MIEVSSMSQPQKLLFNSRSCTRWLDTEPIVLATMLVAAVFAATQTAAAQTNDWPRYGHNGALTGRSPLHGKITKPQTLWSCPTAGRELLLEIVSTPGQHRQQFDANASVSVNPQRKVLIPASPSLDLDGSGILRPATETYHERWAKILPAVKGFQRVAWNQTWTDEKVCRLQLFAYDRGFNQPRLVWQTDPPEDTIFQPLNVVYDLDGNGTPEICVVAHYRVMIFEGTTGRKKTELRYHHSRPYGWFGLADLDGDGRIELITIGDFQSHINVLNYVPSSHKNILQIDRQRASPLLLEIQIEVHGAGLLVEFALMPTSAHRSHLMTHRSRTRDREERFRLRETHCRLRKYACLRGDDFSTTHAHFFGGRGFESKCFPEDGMR